MHWCNLSRVCHHHLNFALHFSKPEIIAHWIRNYLHLREKDSLILQYICFLNLQFNFPLKHYLNCLDDRRISVVACFRCLKLSFHSIWLEAQITSQWNHPLKLNFMHSCHVSFRWRENYPRSLWEKHWMIRRFRFAGKDGNLSKVYVMSRNTSRPLHWALRMTENLKLSLNSHQKLIL